MQSGNFPPLEFQLCILAPRPECEDSPDGSSLTRDCSRVTGGGAC